MKKHLTTIAILLLSMNTAHAGDANQRGIKVLKNLLAGKSLQCVPADHRKPYKASYRGDDGYFTVSVNSKNQVDITDAGDSGYGFSNGGFEDIATIGRKVFLSVGDDGYQTLAIDFDRIGADSNLGDHCAAAALLDYSDFDYDETVALTCCVK